MISAALIKVNGAACVPSHPLDNVRYPRDLGVALEKSARRVAAIVPRDARISDRSISIREIERCFSRFRYELARELRGEARAGVGINKRNRDPGANPSLIVSASQRGASSHPRRIDRSTANRFSVLQCAVHFPRRSCGDKDTVARTRVIPALVHRTFALKDRVYRVSSFIGKFADERADRFTGTFRRR